MFFTVTKYHNFTSRHNILFAGDGRSIVGIATAAYRQLEKRGKRSVSLLFPIAMQAALQAPRVLHASREDCQIIVEIGRAKAAWGLNGPDEPFAVDGSQSDGSVFREDCPWKKLGVGTPKVATAQPGTSAFGVGKPSYSQDGKTATASLDFVSISGQKNIAPFVSMLTCTLDKVSGHWKLRDCRQDFIT